MFGSVDKEGLITITNPLKVDGYVFDDAFLRGLSPAEREVYGVYPVREEGFNEETHRSTGYSYALVDGEIVGTPNLVEIPQEELTRKADEARRSAAIAELAELDKVLPRSTEDLISVLDKWEDPSLAFQKARKERKAVLRSIINETAYLIVNNS